VYALLIANSIERTSAHSINI